jgi:hypothetical protein
MLFPAITGFGDATFVTVICACEVVPTIVDALAVLFAELGSLTEELTVAVSVITVPFAVPAFTLTIIENAAAVLPDMLTVVHTTLPVLPTGGALQLQPAGTAMETKVVPAGTASINDGLSAALGPLLVTICV